MTYIAAKTSELWSSGTRDEIRVTRGGPVIEILIDRPPDNHALPIYQRMLNAEDFLEGSRVFAEKRAPVWKGK